MKNKRVIWVLTLEQVLLAGTAGTLTTHPGNTEEHRRFPSSTWALSRSLGNCPVGDVKGKRIDSDLRSPGTAFKGLTLLRNTQTHTPPTLHAPLPPPPQPNIPEGFSRKNEEEGMRGRREGERDVSENHESSFSVLEN